MCLLRCISNAALTPPQHSRSAPDAACLQFYQVLSSPSITVTIMAAYFSHLLPATVRVAVYIQRLAQSAACICWVSEPSLIWLRGRVSIPARVIVGLAPAACSLLQRSFFAAGLWAPCASNCANFQLTRLSCVRPLPVAVDSVQLTPASSAGGAPMRAVSRGMTSETAHVAVHHSSRSCVVSDPLCQ